MKRRVWLGGAVAVVAGAAGLAASMRSRRGASQAAVDESLWARRFDTPSGGELTLSSLRGQPLLINFWATWCPPCVHEMPMLDTFHQGGSRLKIIGLAIDGPTPVRQFLAKVPVSFPVGLAGLDGADVARRLGNASGGLPFSALFDSSGRLHDRKLGSLTLDDLQRWSKELSPA